MFPFIHLNFNCLSTARDKKKVVLFSTQADLLCTKKRQKKSFFLFFEWMHLVMPKVLVHSQSHRLYLHFFMWQDKPQNVVSCCCCCCYCEKKREKIRKNCRRELTLFVSLFLMWFVHCELPRAKFTWAWRRKLRFYGSRASLFYVQCSLMLHLLLLLLKLGDANFFAFLLYSALTFIIICCVAKTMCATGQTTGTLWGENKRLWDK